MVDGPWPIDRTPRLSETIPPHLSSRSPQHHFPPKECIMSSNGFMGRRVALGLAFTLLFAGALSADEKPKDEQLLNGVWRLISGEADGVPLPEEQLKDGKLVLEDGAYTVTLVAIGAQKGTQKLDPKQDPKTIDITESTGPNKGKTCLGIYDLQGDVFRVVFAPSGQPRPTKFTTAADSGHWMHVWKRAKP